MGKINIQKRKDNGHNKYSVNLDKEIMENVLHVQKGDSLIFCGAMGNEVRFTLVRYDELQRTKKEKGTN